jgi:L-ascorbate metabolism protein UlaG (beta-lactamase superfamily)
LFGETSGKEPEKIIKTTPVHPGMFDSESDDQVAFVWLGHSTLLIRIEGVTLLVDPVLVGERASMFSFMGPKRFAYTDYPGLDDLPPIDAVILSHDHYDHLDHPTIVALKDRVNRFYAPLGVGAHLEYWGISAGDITELTWWDEVEFNGLKLVCTPARHFSGRGFGDRFDTLWGSWAIIGKGTRMYYSGDSGYFPGFKEIGDTYGPFDLTFMECGAYNDAWSEIHMFPEESAQAHVDVRGDFMVPVHWGKFDLSLHTWTDPVDRLTERAREENIHLIVPQVGELVRMPAKKDFTNWWTTYK